jgi:hypothetical protein
VVVGRLDVVYVFVNEKTESFVVRFFYACLVLLPYVIQNPSKPRRRGTEKRRENRSCTFASSLFDFSASQRLGVEGFLFLNIMNWMYISSKKCRAGATRAAGTSST